MPPRDLSMRTRAGLAVGLLVTLLAGMALPHVHAQDAAPVRSEAPPSPRLQPLPEQRQTRHTLTLPGRTLAFTATVGAIPIVNAAGTLLADVGTFAYTLDGAEAQSRPVVFAFNGGPGSSSVWLHLGTLGPWRVPLTTATIAAKGAPELVPNAETWLDLADLVFIDPPGTGYSRVAPGRPQPTVLPLREKGATPPPPEDGVVPRPTPSRAVGGAEWFWSLHGDIETFAEAIVAWLRRSNRTASPVVLVGESYGGFRAPLIADRLAREHRTAVRAMVLVSPVVDFDGRRGGHLPQHYTALLPSLAATHLERTGTTPTRAALHVAEAYARESYVLDLLKGPRDMTAVQRMVDTLTSLTGLPAGAVASASGRISARAFVQHHPALSGQLVSGYDAGMAFTEDRAINSGRGDPFTGLLDAPLGRAIDALTERLEWKPGRRYQLMSYETTRNWIWRNSPHPPETISTLQALLRGDKRMRVLLTHGFTDLVTPYFATATQLDLLPFQGAWDRVAFEVYPGGHMFYSRDGSRARFRDDGGRLIAEALGTSAKRPSGERRETP